MVLAKFSYFDLMDEKKTFVYWGSLNQ